MVLNIPVPTGSGCPVQVQITLNIIPQQPNDALVECPTCKSLHANNTTYQRFAASAMSVCESCQKRICVQCIPKHYRCKHCRRYLCYNCIKGTCDEPELKHEAE